MTRLSIRHETTYQYGQPVSFGPQRLLIRPRDSHADRLVEASLKLYPPGDTRWAYDANGNCICWYQPWGESSELSIVSNLVIERFPAPLAPLTVSDPHTAMPIVYNMADRAVLEPFITPATDSNQAVMEWVRGHMGQADEPALEFLTNLTRAIQREFAYGERFVFGVQSPAETIAQGSGTCRDFAWLMIEALRVLGYAARFVTGYLYSPSLDVRDCNGNAVNGAGATHAWCEVFLPSLGWLEFDPTNGLVESPDLIHVGATRTPQEAAPVSGDIIGNPLSSSMFVDVQVHAEDANGLTMAVA